MSAILKLRRLTQWGFAGALTLTLLAWSARADDGNGDNQNNGNDKDHGRGHNEKGEHYRQLNLVSDLADPAGGAPVLMDSDLVNAWGISFSSTSPFWISDNGTGKSTLYKVTYDAMGNVTVTKLPLVVTIPPDDAGTPTGQVFGGGFDGEAFIFATEDGLITGWHTGTSAETVATAANGVYKGVTLAMAPSGMVLLAANFRNGTIDEYMASTTVGGTLSLIGQFKDPKAPAGYAPFNVQNIEGTVFVTYAKQDDAKHDDVRGPGNGLIDIFHTKNGKFTRFATGSDAGGDLSEINSPWGIALAPSTFGQHNHELLVGNFGSGTIMAFHPVSGKFQGLLEGTDDNPIVIDGLWGLAFGNDGSAGRSSTLYFTAGLNGEQDGLFGSLDSVTDDESGDD